MRAFNKSVFLSVVLSILILASCKVEKAKIVTETVKDLSGSWSVIKVVRNGADITASNGVDLSQFRINFQQATGTYTLTSPIPFIVSTKGKYALNNSNVPTRITFTQDGSAGVTTLFNYPIAGAVRNISFQFSANPGCADNTYIYTLQKAN